MERRAMHLKYRLRGWAASGGQFGIVAAFTAFLAFPFYWMVITTFKQTGDLMDKNANPLIFHDWPTLEQLRYLFQGTEFGLWLWNTAWVGGLVVTITVLLAVPAGYSLARLIGPTGGSLGIGIFLTYLVPPTILFIPFSRIIADLGLQNSLWSLVLVYPSFTVPFCTWLMMGFFKSIPADLEEAAMLDGYDRLQAFLRVVVPISMSGILTSVIFAFALVIQEFLYAVTFVSTATRMTVSVGVPTYAIRGDVYYWGSLMAGCIIASVPIAIVYNIFVDRFVAGFTVGAIK
jgi:multiple sugar transport system permease protein